MNQKILTLHPDNKQGVNIDVDKYETVKNAIETALTKGPLTFTDMVAETSHILKQQGFNGSPSWYITTVKLDLQARGLIQVSSSSPQVIKLT